jgi:hypothetical protein
MGTYKDMPDRPYQECLTEPKLLYGNGNITIIEKLGELNKDSQELIAQVINERIFNVLGNSKLARSFFTLPFISMNPDDEPKVVPPLRDRINFGYVMNVVNEVGDKTTLTEDENWIKFFAAYIRRSISHKPFDKAGLNEVVEVAKRMSDNIYTPAITRSWISIVMRACILAKEDDSTYTTDKHVKEAERETRSLVQSILENRVNEHCYEKYLFNDDTKYSSEKVKILALLRDENLIKEVEKSAGEVFESYKLSLEDSVGYLTEISAFVKKVRDASESKFLVTKEFDGIEDYKRTVIGMLEKDGFDTSKYSIFVDTSKLFNIDETIIPATYLLLYSQLSKKPKKIRQDKALAVSMDILGNVIPADKINRRIFYSPDNVKEIVVTQYDLENRTKESYYPNKKLIPVVNKEKLLEEMLYEK